VINASPRLPEAFVVVPGAKSSGKAGVPWGVRTFVCDYGELNVADYGPPGLAIHTKFCFDFTNFSPATAPTEPHELVLWDLTATARSDPPFLRLDLVRAKFDLEGLINKQTVNALTLEGGSLDRMDLMKSLAESQKTSFPEIQGKQAELWRNRSFKGEWIETPGPDGLMEVGAGGRLAARRRMEKGAAVVFLAM
jgi:hypothetical protein